MNNQRGISLITLVVTIMVMIILIGVVGKYSLENIQEATNAVMDSEFANIRDFTMNVQNQMLLGDFEIDLNQYPDIVLSNELLYIIAKDKLQNIEINNIIDVNSADIDDDYKYYYFQADSTDYFETRTFSKDNIRVQDVKYDYIINFYTGTVIGIYDETAKVDGLIKGLGEIVAETSV
ncbi:MAG: hypothetical protein IKJ32_06405 [Clostridia bacterium]|nr:hypothetical protein [Clostridia bacterium]